MQSVQCQPFLKGKLIQRYNDILTGLKLSLSIRFSLAMYNFYFVILREKFRTEKVIYIFAEQSELVYFAHREVRLKRFFESKRG